MIQLQHVCAGYRGRAVLQDISLSFTPGEVLVLAGPNGCGKSTLLRTALGLLPCISGQVLYNGTPCAALTARQIARQAAFLSQSRAVPNITARRMVLHGRFPHLSYPRRYTAEDFRIVDAALSEADAADLADRPLPELSGGQRQKVYLAMAIAQQTPTLLMDEPTTFLDIRHQLAAMAMARRLAAGGRAVVLVLHDLPLALRTADRLAVLADGRLLYTDTPQRFFESRLLEQVFGVRLARCRTDNGWRYSCESAGF